jgi:hypothetical protein
MLSLSNIIHKIQYNSDALTIALVSHSMNSNNLYISYLIANIYVVSIFGRNCVLKTASQ